MEVAGFIAKRVAFNQQRSFSRFIIRLSIVATVISVAVMIITLGFANGFKEKVGEKVFSFLGHIRVQAHQSNRTVVTEEEPLERNDIIAGIIRAQPHVRSIHPFASRNAILKTREDISGVLLKGLDRSFNDTSFSTFLQKGSFIHFNDSTYSREIIISARTAAELKLDTGSRILIYFIQPDGQLRPDKLTVTGIYKTGIEEYDKNIAIGDLKLIQRLNGWAPSQIGGYEIFLDDYHNIDKVADQLQQLDDFPVTWDALSVRRIAPNIFDWLNMMDGTRNFLLAIMVVVAIINLATCLIILVLERVRMVGVLKALGATNWTIQRIFLYHSALITGIGIVAGTALGLAVLALQSKTGFIRMPEDAYYLDRAAVSLHWWEVVFIAGATLVLTLLVLTIPSLMARRIKPVRAIRFE